MEEAVRHLLSMGHKHGQDGEIFEAIKCFIQAVSTDPNSVEARLLLGNAYGMIGFFDEAQEQYEEVLHLDPRHGATFSSLANCLLAKYLENEMEIDSIEEIFSKETQAIFRDVEKYSAKAIEFGDTEQQTYSAHALALAYLGMGEKAYQIINQCVDNLDQEGREIVADKIAKLGLVYLRIKKAPSNAHWYYLAARELNPNDPSLGELEGELHVFRTSNGDEKADTLARLGNICESNPNKGLEIIQSLIEENPQLGSDPFFRFCRALAYGSKGLFKALRELSLAEEQLAEISSWEARDFREKLRLTDEHLDYLEVALREVREIEIVDPRFVAMIGTDEERFGEAKVDCISIALERCRPGKVQELMGTTKLLYFGPEHRRMGLRPGLDLTLKDYAILWNPRFSAPLVVKAAIAMDKGVDGRDRRFVTCLLYQKCFDEWEPNDTLATAPSAGAIYFFDDGLWHHSTEIDKVFLGAAIPGRSLPSEFRQSPAVMTESHPPRKRDLPLEEPKELKGKKEKTRKTSL